MIIVYFIVFIASIFKLKQNEKKVLKLVLEFFIWIREFSKCFFFLFLFWCQWFLNHNLQLTLIDLIYMRDGKKREVAIDELFGMFSIFQSNIAPAIVVNWHISHFHFCKSPFHSSHKKNNIMIINSSKHSFAHTFIH